MAEVKIAHSADKDRRSPLDERVLTLVGTAGIARSNDLRSQGIHPQQLRRLTESGALVRVSRGCDSFALNQVIGGQATSIR